MILHNNKRYRHHSVADINRLKIKAAELIPLLVAKGVSAAALVVHAGVMPALLQMLACNDILEGGSMTCKCAAAAVASLSRSSPLILESTDTKSDDDDEGLASVPEVVLNMGFVQLLGQMTRHPAEHCRHASIEALRSILAASSAAPSDSQAVSRALETSVRTYFSEDRDAVQSLLAFLGGSKNTSSRKDAANIVLACVDVLFLIAAHPRVQSALSDAGAVTVLLDLVDTSLHGSLAHFRSNASSGGLPLRCESCTVLDKSIAILRHISWNHTENLLVVVENGLETITVLIKSARVETNLLSHCRIADVIWILNGVIPYCASILFAVGCIEEILLVIFTDSPSVILEAALTLISQVIELDNFKYRLRLVVLAGHVAYKVGSEVNVLPSPHNDLSIFSNSDVMGGGDINLSRLADRIRHLAEGVEGVCNSGCQIAALCTLKKLFVENKC